MKRKKKGERGRRGLFIPLGNLFVCLRVCTNRWPQLISENLFTCRSSNEDFKKIWRLSPSNSVEAFAANAKLWPYLEKCVCSIWGLRAALTMNISKCQCSSTN